MFKQVDVRQERDLEALVTNDIQALEQGLVYLTHQKEANRKFIGVLAVDKNSRLVVIELKVWQEDEMILQASEGTHGSDATRRAFGSGYQPRW